MLNTGHSLQDLPRDCPIIHFESSALPARYNEIVLLYTCLLTDKKAVKSSIDSRTKNVRR